MGTEFRTYKLEDFLDDPDFCSWARSERPDMDGYYQQLIDQYPEQKSVFRKAFKLIRLFDDEKISTDLPRKLQLWEETKSIYRQHNSAAKYFKLILRYAAIVVLLLSFGSLVYYIVSPTPQNEFISSYSKQDFTESKLLLDNGKQIDIQAEQTDIVYDQSGNQIKINDKTVQKGATTSSSEMNQLIVAFGKQSRLVLSDRTEVWLNAGSRLVYPTTFEGDKRKVKLQGEAYFHVCKDKTKPFIVETENSSIKVLGTSFNVKAYPDEKFEETVLVEGSVSLNPGKKLFGKNIILKP